MDLLSKEDVLLKCKSREPYFLYLYTPMCGTCQVAEKMLTIVEEVDPAVHVGKTDINYIPELAEKAMIESVPCLVFIKDGTIHHKMYAFQSVPFLLGKIKEFNQY